MKMAVLAILLAAVVVVGCGGDSDGEPARDGDPAQGAGAPAKTLGLAKPKESFGEARERIARVIDPGNCDRINQLYPVSRQPTRKLNARCRYLARLEGLEPIEAQRYRGGWLLEYAIGEDRVMSAIRLLDSDGRYHVAYIDAFRAAPSVGTKLPANRFDRTAGRAVTALAEGDCDGLLDVAFVKFGAWALPKRDACNLVDRSPIPPLRESFPEIEPERLGGNGTFAFYSLSTPGVAYTLLLQRQATDDLPGEVPEGVGEIPDGAAEYAYVDLYLTNRREAGNGSSRGGDDEEPS